ncbi:hypothetical protein Ocin01_00433 [Orchesella cincta]|uniref:DnaJ subfamily C member 1 n=1 Tax=Orchesella cincta TaxID=48709 RepID=A0A1D2NM00_ORCCI|nr:hypothetical protein Ocin01_00433 [Orchesella cincta]
MQVFGCKYALNIVLSLVFISSFVDDGPVRGALAWDNAEFEMFDLVEEVGKNFYEVIGVTPDATLKEIKKAYRTLSVKIHPDKSDAPDASEKFRQLVGIYEVLKDDTLRKSYDDVLVNGLPNWRQPIFYFRRARKLAIWQVSVILLAIISVGQYLAGWASYFEQRLSLRESIESKMRQKQRTRRAQKDGPTAEEIEAEMDEYLQKPSLLNIAPFQLCRGVKYLIFNLPGDILAHMQYMKEQKEEEEREQARVQEMLEEQKKIAEQPKKPRKRKTFAIPEKEYDEDDDADDKDETESKETSKTSVRPTYVSGGLWTDEDLAELAKLCSKFPGGTPERWEKISDALMRPVPEVTFMAKKIMEKLTKRPEEEEEYKPQVKVKVKTRKADAIAAGEIDNVANWSVEEQKYLEKALLTYPKGALERWDKIAMMVPGRTKDECMKRFKYVAELVKKKKEQAEGTADNNAESNAKEKETPEDSEVAANANVPKESPSDTPDQSSELSSKDSVERKNSSSSNKSSSDGDWCLVDTSSDQQQ